ncbi:MAG: 50S ribosomal protein L25 [Acidimicrobiia bacterium]|nr:50S ribosomal protein L25 [Acidimicrobiia bacterium]
MEEVVLTAEAGRTTGSATARRLRGAGRIPAVLYGHGVDPQALAVEGRALRLALNTEAGLNALISLDVSGDRHLAMARQLQRDPVRGTVAHVDFVIVRRDEVVTVEVPVHLEGEASLVHREDGLVEQQLFSLTVNATPSSIPSHIEVDITNLGIGDAIRVGDLTLPSGVSTDVDPEEPVVAGQASRVSAEVEAEEAEAEAETAAVAAGTPEGGAGDAGGGGAAGREG